MTISKLTSAKGLCKFGNVVIRLFFRRNMVLSAKLLGIRGLMGLK